MDVPLQELRPISIHALREEGDEDAEAYRTRLSIFQSTPSARRATSAWTAAPPSRQNFNPRPPRGGRPKAAVLSPPCAVFQSTPSARRATVALRCLVAALGISIHALREEGDICDRVILVNVT